jgi:thymidylate kinase
MLGQDGAGKSTTIDAIEHSKNLPFGQTIVWGFAPPMHRLFKRGPVKTDTPHALPPRSFLMSMAKAIYWMIHAILGHFTLRLAKSKNTLVLYDRHFTDVLVDPIRYRFGGPNWMLDLIFRLTPRPDLILLLDAPPDILHERKPELELSERHRQRKKYLELVARLPNSVIVDATKSQAQVIETVQTKIVDRLIANQR